METIRFIKMDVDTLYRVRNEHFDEDKQFIKKFKIELNEYNVIQLINSIESIKTSHNKNFTETKKSPKVCPQCMSEKTIKCNEIGDRLCKDCGYTYEDKPS